MHAPTVPPRLDDGGPCLPYGRTRRIEAGMRGLLPGLELLGVEPRQWLVAVHPVVEVDEHLGDAARDLRADVHLQQRLQRAGGGHADHQLGVLDRPRVERHRR